MNLHDSQSRWILFIASLTVRGHFSSSNVLASPKWPQYCYHIIIHITHATHDGTHVCIWYLFLPRVLLRVQCTPTCAVGFVLFIHKVHYWHNYIVLSSPCLPKEPQRGEKEATPWPPLPPLLPPTLPPPLPPPYVSIRERLLVVVMMTITRTPTLLTTMLPPPLVSPSASIKERRKVRVIVSYLSASIASLPTDTDSNFHIC